MVHIETPKVKVLRVNQKNPKFRLDPKVGTSCILGALGCCKARTSKL